MARRASELTEIPLKEWSGGNHTGRLRFQTFRPYTASR